MAALLNHMIFTLVECSLSWLPVYIVRLSLFGWEKAGSFRKTGQNPQTYFTITYELLGNNVYLKLPMPVFDCQEARNGRLSQLNTVDW